MTRDNIGIDRVDLKRVIEKAYSRLKSETICSNIVRMNNCIRNESGVVEIIVQKGSIFKHNRIITQGVGNRLEIGENSRVVDSMFFLIGSNNCFVLGDRCGISNAEAHLDGNGNAIQIGEGFTSGSGLRLSAFEGTKIEIGKDNMLSEDVYFRTSDGHSIVDEQDRRLNPAKDISVGDHCWFGKNTAILKGAHIGNNVIVGYGGVVCSGTIQNNVVIAGIPAKVVRNDVRWIRERV